MRYSPTTADTLAPASSSDRPRGLRFAPWPRYRYAAGVWVRSYYLFGIGLLWNNFFGNTVGVASVYFGQLFHDRWLCPSPHAVVPDPSMWLCPSLTPSAIPLHDSPAERDLYVGLVMGMLMVGASIGAFIVMPFSLSPANGALLPMPTPEPPDPPDLTHLHRPRRRELLQCDLAGNRAHGHRLSRRHVRDGPAREA